MKPFATGIRAIALLIIFSHPCSGCFCAPSPVEEPCERTGIVFIGHVTHIEPQSWVALREQLLGRLPKQLADRLNSEWSSADEREALQHLLPMAEWKLLSSASDSEIRDVFETRFLTRKVTVQVVDPFKEIDETTATFLIGPSDCDVQFQEDRSYLIYAWRNNVDGGLRTGVCAGTRRVEDAAADLQYYRSVRAGTAKGHVSGFVTREPTDLQLPFRASKPVVGAGVILQRTGSSQQAVTNSEGRYVFEDLAPGTYTLTARSPEDHDIQRPRTISLSVGSCPHENFLAVSVGKISGRLLDVERHPVPGRLVEIEAVPPTQQPRPIFQEFTDQTGAFEKSGLVAGEYRLVLNPKDPPNARDWYGRRLPHGRIYYPGVENGALAQIFRLEPGQEISHVEFRLPHPPLSAGVSGTVTDPAGQPANDISVWLFDSDYPVENGRVDSAQTAADGQFTMTGAAGRKCLIFAHQRNGTRHVYAGPVEITLPLTDKLQLPLRNADPEHDCEVCAKFRDLW